MKPEARKFWANSSSTCWKCFWHWTIVVKGSVEYFIAGPRCQGSTGCASGGGEGAPSSWSWTRRENQTGSGWSLGPHRGSAGGGSSGRPLDSFTIGPRFESRLIQAVNFFCPVKLDANESRSNFNFLTFSMQRVVQRFQLKWPKCIRGLHQSGSWLTSFDLLLICYLSRSNMWHC